MQLPQVGSVANLLVFPRSGFINRFQTLASSQILANQLGSEFEICWLPCPFVSGPATETFSEDFCDRYVLSEVVVQDRYGISLDTIPRYVSESPSGSWVGLRGHDRGEQALMPELTSRLSADIPMPLLVVVAGGSFYLPEIGLVPDLTVNRFLGAKRDFYQHLPLNAAVESAVDAQLQADPLPYLGLHLRYTDRAYQAPFPRAIRKALSKISGETGIRRVFIASDSGAARQHWHQEVRALGLEPWSFNAPPGTVSGVHAALIDWRLLTHAKRLVYFSASSYSTEAAVAAGVWEQSAALDPHPLRSVAVRAHTYANAGINRFRGGRPTG